MRKASPLVGLVLVFALVAAACGDDDDSSGAPTIGTFDIATSVECTEDPALVPVSWSTTDADSVTINVDGVASPSVTDQPANGSGNVPIACDGRSHPVELVATGSGGQTASSTKEVTAAQPSPTATPTEEPTATPTPTEEPTPTPTAAPEAGVGILQFAVDPDTSCTAGSEGSVSAEWQTTGANAVEFSVDGSPVPADAGQPTSGTGNIPVPCDGQSHLVSLQAIPAGGSPTSSSWQVVLPDGTLGSPSVASLGVPGEIPCTGDTAQVLVGWETDNTTTVSISVDGSAVGAQAGLPISGSEPIPVPCDGQPHTIELVASGSSGDPASQQAQVTTQPS